MRDVAKQRTLLFGHNAKSHAVGPLEEVETIATRSHSLSMRITGENNYLRACPISMLFALAAYTRLVLPSVLALVYTEHATSIQFKLHESLAVDIRLGYPSLHDLHALGGFAS